MAVKWAVANGNWSAGTTWNDGVVPAVGDEVYLNRHNITYDSNINLGNGWLRNDANSDYGIVSGGSVQSLSIDRSMSLICNCYADASNLIYIVFYRAGYKGNVNIFGDCVCPTSGFGLIHSSNNTASHVGVIVNGNVDASRGGSLIYNSFRNTFTINGNVVLGNGYLWTATNNYICDTGYLNNTINGKVTCIDGASGGILNTYFGISGSTINISDIDILNGNVVLQNSTNAVIHYLNIGGNFKVKGVFDKQPNARVNITGNIVVSENNFTIFLSIDNFTCSGDIELNGIGYLIDNVIMANGTIRIDGDIILRGKTSILHSFTPSISLFGENLHIESSASPLGAFDEVVINNNDFKITYIGEKPQIILLSKYQLDNTDQYPPEDEVKEGTEYVWGEKVGTYQQPPESVVLKDYVYDNGDKIGTLENEVIVDNTNTINVYPYKRRR